MQSNFFKMKISIFLKWVNENRYIEFLKINATYGVLTAAANVVRNIVTGFAIWWKKIYSRPDNEPKESRSALKRFTTQCSIDGRENYDSQLSVDTTIIKHDMLRNKGENK